MDIWYDAYDFAAVVSHFSGKIKYVVESRNSLRRIESRLDGSWGGGFAQKSDVSVE